VSSYTLPSVGASGCADEVELVPGATRMVAVPVSALACPVRQGSAGDGRSALVVAGAPAIRSGEPVAFCKIVTVAPAVVRRDGRVQAKGRPGEQVRLGAAEQELDRRCGPGTIDRIAAGVHLTGTKIKAKMRREMSVAFTIRAVLLMALMPQADYREVLTALLGDLTEVPWQRAHAVPSATAFAQWRAAIGAGPLQQLQKLVLAAAVAEHRRHGGQDGGAPRGAVVSDGGERPYLLAAVAVG